jgi:hypothetical protein
LLISKNSASWSNPRNLRFNKLAAIPVVLLPVKGSKIQALGCVDDKMIRDNTPKGFCVGCFPHDFSHVSFFHQYLHRKACLFYNICGLFSFNLSINCFVVQKSITDLLFVIVDFIYQFVNSNNAYLFINLVLAPSILKIYDYQVICFSCEKTCHCGLDPQSPFHPLWRLLNMYVS